MGEAGEGMNITHQQKKMDLTELKAFRDRFKIPVPDDQIDEVPLYRPADDSVEMQYLREQPRARWAAACRSAAANRSSSRCRRWRRSTRSSRAPSDREISTTMAFVRILSTLLRDKNIGSRVVPIVPDESRTFGMEGMFRQLGIFSQVGQLYKPEDSGQLMFYREHQHGQILQEGINEAGAMSSWIAAATSYSVPQPADDPVLHLLFDVRLSARRRSRLGGGRHRAAAASCWAALPGARRSTAKACSTPTAKAI